MKKANKFLSVFLALIMIISIIPMSSITASAAETSGTCGENLTWKFDESTGTLTISGTGEMDNYSSYSSKPWTNFNDNIKEVVIYDGVTTIGDYAFYECEKLENVTIPDSVISIGSDAFSGCLSLESVYVPDSVTSFGYSVFEWCTNLKSFRMPNYDYGHDVLGVEFKSPSKITMYENEFILDFMDEDQTTIVEIGKDVESFDGFILVLFVCGLVEEIILDEENNNFKLIDGVLYNSDITELCLYPTASDKKEYIMPDTVVSEFATFILFSEESLSSLQQITIANGGPLCSIDNAINLEKLTFGKNYRYCMTDFVISVLDKVDDYEKKEEKLEYLFSILGELTETKAFLPILGNNLKKFSVNEDNKYITNKDGVVFIKHGEYKIAISTMFKTIDYLKVEKNEFYSSSLFYFNEINTLELTDGYIEDLHSYFYSEDADYLSKYISAFVYAPIGAYKVSETNDYFTTVDGVLYSKDGKILVGYPMKSTRTSFVVPESVEVISRLAFGYYGDGCFYRNNNLKLHISETTLNAFRAGGSGDSVLYLPMLFGGICFSDEATFNLMLDDEIEITLDEYNSFFDEENAKIEIARNEMYEEYSVYDKINKTSSERLLSVYLVFVSLYFSHAEICDGNHPVHEHEFKITKTTAPTCTERGYTTYTCECGESYDSDYIEQSHTSKTIALPASCTVNGMEYSVCEVCGESLGDAKILPAPGHTAGEWETVLEPTYEADGLKVRKCTVCGEVVEEEIIPMLVKVTVIDEGTGVAMEYDQNDYNGDVEIVVEESFDGTAFDVIDTSLNASQKFIYDITMTVDGEVTQPTGKVTIRIPLPKGYDPARSFVYHVDTETGKVEKIHARYEDGYLVFETTHFSYYAVVEEYNYTFSIQNPSRKEIRNKDGIILHANVEGTAPTGSYVKWESSNGNFSKDADGSNLEIIAKNKGYTTFTAILCDADGKELARDTVEMYSNSGFFQKIGGFFRSLFGLTNIYEN